MATSLLRARRDRMRQHSYPFLLSLSRAPPDTPRSPPAFARPSETTRLPLLSTPPLPGPFVRHKAFQDSIHRKRSTSPIPPLMPSRDSTRSLPALSPSPDQAEEEKTFLQCTEQKALHVRLRKGRSDHKHADRGICIRCLQRGKLPRSCNVIRVGGGYLILSADGETVLLGSISKFRRLSALPFDVDANGRRAHSLKIGLSKQTIKERLEDGTIVFDDGSRLLPDGTRVLADGTRILPDGSIVDADGNFVDKIDTSRLSMEDMLSRLGSEVPGASGRRASLGAAALRSATQRPGSRKASVSSYRGSSAAKESFKGDAQSGPSDSDSDTDSGHGGGAGAGLSHGSGSQSPAGRDGAQGGEGSRARDLAWHFEAEVMEVLADGTRILKDGTRINPDGSMTLADGTAIDPAAAQKLAIKRKITIPPRKPGETEEQYQARIRRILGEPDPARDGGAGGGAGGDSDGDGPSYDPLSRYGMPGKQPRNIGKSMPAAGRRSSAEGKQRSNSWSSHLNDAQSFLRRGDMTKNALDYLARYCILDEVTLANFSSIFKHIDRDGDGVISMTELEFGLKTVNKSMISDKETRYVEQVLEMTEETQLNFRLFAVVAALSQRVVDLDYITKGLISKMDMGALGVKMNKCKQLFYLLDEKEEGYVEMDTLMHEVRAGRISPEHEDIILKKFGEDGRTWVDFLLYISYIPLFLEIHGTITDNPLDDRRDK